MQACQAGMLHDLATNVQTVILQPHATDHAGGSALIDAGCKRRQRRQLPPLQGRGGCRTPRLLQQTSHAKQMLYCNEHSNGTNTEHCHKLQGCPAKANRHDYVLPVARRLERCMRTRPLQMGKRLRSAAVGPLRWHLAYAGLQTQLQTQLQRRTDAWLLLSLSVSLCLQLIDHDLPLCMSRYQQNLPQQRVR